VGSAPAESLLRDLAEKTGGACELVSPNQDVADVIFRMFRRMRSVRCHDVKVDWAQDVTWQTAAPKVLYGGDTLHLCARMSTKPSNAPVLSWVSGETAQQSAAGQINSDASGVLSRIVASQQITELSEQLQQTLRAIEYENHIDALKAQSLDLALRYQLVTDQTNLILVHVREEGMKAEGLPSLEKTAHMQAAGWGGAGSVMSDSNDVRFSSKAYEMAHACAPDYGSMSIPSVWRTRDRSDAAAKVDALLNGGIDDFEIPAFMRTDADAGSTSKFTLTKLIKRSSGGIRTVDCGSVVTPLELLKAFSAVSQKTLAASRFVRDMQALKVPDHLTKLLDDFTVILGSGRKAWSVVIEWLSEHLAEQFTLSRQAERLLRNSLKGEDAVILEELKQRLAKVIGPAQVNAWEPMQTSE
jgi:Ca-activated chloride channel family protein